MPQVTTKEASQILGISKRTLFRWEKEGRIKNTREGILNVRVYDRNYIVMAKEILDLDKQLDEHQAKLPGILEQRRKHPLEQDYHPGKTLHLLSPSEQKAAIKAIEDETAWETEHNRLIAKLASYPKDIRSELLKD